MNKTWKTVAGIIVALILGWLAFGFFGIQAIFIDNTVDEEVPNSVLNQIAEEQTLIGKGSFDQGDSTYTISGNAFLSQTGEALNLTFTDFKVSNGPDLFVYAVKTNSTDNTTVKDTVAQGGFINLGTLKGNIGDQNYTLDKSFDANEYEVIAIWCRRFSRNFGSAKLSANPSKPE